MFLALLAGCNLTTQLGGGSGTLDVAGMDPSLDGEMNWTGLEAEDFNTGLLQDGEPAGADGRATRRAKDEGSSTTMRLELDVKVPIEDGGESAGQLRLFVDLDAVERHDATASYLSTGRVHARWRGGEWDPEDHWRRSDEAVFEMTGAIEAGSLGVETSLTGESGRSDIRLDLEWSFDPALTSTSRELAFYN